MDYTAGPSYSDVEAHVDYLRDTYGVGVDFLLVPPLVVGRTGKRHPWHVSAKSWRLGDALSTALGAQASFGKGGTWKTLPAAQLAALRTLQAKHEEAEAVARSQAAF